MKISKFSQVERVASVDKSRASITQPYLDKEMGKVISTNGSAMAIVNVEVGEHDASGYVTAEALQAGRKITGDKVDITANGCLKLANGTSMVRPTDEHLGQFPKWQQVVPSLDRDVCFKVAINAELLLDLAKAIGNGKSNIVLLTFTNDKDSILVKGSNPDAFGILMPARFR